MAQIDDCAEPTKRNRVPLDPAILEAYRRDMAENTIPAIAEDIYRRQQAAEVSRRTYIRT